MPKKKPPPWKKKKRGWWRRPKPSPSTHRWCRRCGQARYKFVGRCTHNHARMPFLPGFIAAQTNRLRRWIPSEGTWAWRQRWEISGNHTDGTHDGQVITTRIGSRIFNVDHGRSFGVWAALR